MRSTTLVTAVLTLLCGAFTVASAPSADDLLSRARDKAAMESKTIFVDFSASW